MNSLNVFAERIKLLRIQSTLTQQQLGEAVGLSKQAINDIEHCRRTTTLDNLVAFANYFNVTTDYLLGLSDDPNS